MSQMSEKTLQCHYVAILFLWSMLYGQKGQWISSDGSRSHYFLVDSYLTWTCGHRTHGHTKFVVIQHVLATDEMYCLIVTKLYIFMKFELTGWSWRQPIAFPAERNRRHIKPIVSAWCFEVYTWKVAGKKTFETRWPEALTESTMSCNHTNELFRFLWSILFQTWICFNQVPNQILFNGPQINIVPLL